MKKFVYVVLILSLIVLVVWGRIFRKPLDKGDEMIDKHEPIVVEFLLRGEWLVPNTLGTKIPSHGTNQLGTRYAYDFIQVDWERKGRPSYQGGLWQYLSVGISISDFYCWGQEIYAPCAGIVVQAEDGYPERERTNIRLDMSSAYKNAHYFDPTEDDVQLVAGNYVIIDCGDNVYAALCHLQTGSIQVVKVCA